jgi:phage N-6-adenine-methyltransferase
MKNGQCHFNRGNSEQSVGTPEVFMSAVRSRFDTIYWDLAASAENAKAPKWISEQEDSLTLDWGALPGNLWLNPPYSNIAPWAAKCAERKNDARWTMLLVPASVGSIWFQDHVAPNAFVLELVGRLTFVGHNQPYPKDLILAAFGFGVVGRAAWKWR